MNREEILAFYNDIPEIIDSPIKMDGANSPIKIYEGEFLITNGDIELTVNGLINYNWVPISGPHFSGITKLGFIDAFGLNRQLSNINLKIGGLDFGKGHVTSVNAKDDQELINIEGVVSGQAINGDRTIAVEKVKFSIPNLLEFFGAPVKKVTDTGISSSLNRLVLENELYRIIIDKNYSYSDDFKSLNSKGGYIILYGGELIGKKNGIIIENIKETLYSLNTFLSFFNGRSTSALFIHGIYEQDIKWVDYSSYHVDIYKAVHTWPPKHSIKGLNEIWRNFTSIWRNKTDRDFLITVIHWYVEVNGLSGMVEGSIVMAQTALELIYNRLIIEKKKLLIGKDSENINASNKIRLLISQINVSYSVPDSLTHLKSFIAKDEVEDAPAAIVLIRNSIVHSQEEKRKKLNNISGKVKYEALQLCIWYIELSILYILNYEGEYNNRCLDVFSKDEKVPWGRQRTEEKQD